MGHKLTHHGRAATTVPVGRTRTAGIPLIYQHKDRNPCPDCDGVHWYIGRMTAECAQCGTALKLSTFAGRIGDSQFVSHCSSTISN